MLNTIEWLRHHNAGNILDRLRGLGRLAAAFEGSIHPETLPSPRSHSLLAGPTGQLKILRRSPIFNFIILDLKSRTISGDHDVRVLRYLGDLASLTLNQNPLCDERYPAFVLAHLPRLDYLDHRRVTQEALADAQNVYREEVAVVEAEEEAEQTEDTRKLEEQTSKRHHQRAGVYALNDGSLFDKMFDGDQDMAVLLQLPGAQTLMTKYRDQFNAVCMRVFNAGLDHEKERLNELTLLHDALQQAKTQADQHARIVVLDLEEELNSIQDNAHVIREAEEASMGDDQEEHQERVVKMAQLQEQYQGALNSTAHYLMDQEVTLADQIKEVVGHARDELGTLVGGFLEQAASDLKEGRTMAYTFYCRLRELSSKVAEAGGAADEGTNEASKVFEGADTLAAALAGIHDRHLMLIHAREEELRSHLRQWLKDTLADITQAEWRRHRSRVEEMASMTQRKTNIM
ncbi:unnamed protein product, partial [Meganyctiphanes norvegica]